jgi:SutA RNAP-binding domain
MATKPLKTVGKKKQPAAVETSSSLDDKIKAFLAAGGEIEQVKSGISGQPSMAPQKTKPSASKDSK